MFRLLASGFALTLLLSAVAADDKKDQDKVVSWEREQNGIDLKFDFLKEKDKLTISAFNGDNGVMVTCKMSIDKKGLVKAKITEVEEKGKFPAVPKVGLELTFKWKVEGDVATLSDLTGEGVEEAKGVLEGEYKRKKK